MDNWFKFSEEILVMIVIALPPFLYLHEFIMNLFYRNENRSSCKKLYVLFQFLIYIAYCAGTIVLSNIVPAVTVLFLIVYSRRLLKERNINSNLEFTQSTWDFSVSRFVKVSLFGIIAKYAITVINGIFIIILNMFKVKLVNQDIVNIFLESNIYQSIYYFILAVICAPIVEEFVFRYWFYNRIFKKMTGPAFAAILSSILFMGAHFNLQGAVAFFLVGIVNCYLFDKFGYWSAVANHFVFNFTSILILITAKNFL